MGSRTRRVIQAVILASGLLVGPGGLLPPAERAHAAPAPSAAAVWQGYLDGHAQLAHRLAAVVGAPLERLAAVVGAPLERLAAAVVGTPLERLLGAVLPEAGPGRAAPAGAASGILGALVGRPGGDASGILGALMGRPGFDGQPAAVLAQGGPTLGARPAVVAAGGTLGATWSGIVGPTAKDWVGVYVPNTPDGSSRPPVWRYTDGSASDDVAIPIPAGFAQGSYELRLFQNDGYARLATSNCFVVGLPNNACFLLEPPPPNTEFNPPLVNAETAGSGVNTLTGAYSTSHTDVAIDGRGPAPKLTRTYNSNDPRLGPLGPGWAHNYAMRLVQPAAGNPNVVLVGAQGRSDHYTLQLDGTYTARPGVYVTLQKLANGTHTATAKDQGVWTFDVQGRLVSIIDRHGSQSTLSYNTAGQLLNVSDPAQRDPAGLGLRLTYHPTTGRLVSVTDWHTPARVVSYGYDASGRLQTVTDRTAAVTTYGYSGTSSRLTTITNANNHLVLTNVYDPTTGRVSSQQDGLSHATTFGYNSLVTTVTAPATTYEPTFQPTVVDTYYGSGFLASRLTRPTSNPAELMTQGYTYDAIGNRQTATDSFNQTTTYCYDQDHLTGAPILGSRGNLTRTIQPAGVDGRAVVSLARFDAKNNVVETRAPLGIVPDPSYPVTCATNLETDPNVTLAPRHRSERKYDDATLTRLVEAKRYATDPDTAAEIVAVTRYRYEDPANPGAVTAEIPPRGNTGPLPDLSYATTHAYHPPGPQAGLKESTTDPLGNKVSYTYDAVGRRVTMIDALGHAPGGNPAQHTWTYTYDAEDRKLGETSPAVPNPTPGYAGLHTTYEYDPVGNRTAVIDARSPRQTTRYRYDTRALLERVEQSPTPGADPFTASDRIWTRYTYDAPGKLLRTTKEQAGSAPVRGGDSLRDGLGRVRQEVQYPQWPALTPTLVTTTSYDANGRQTGLTRPKNQLISYGYDALGRKTGTTYSDGGTTAPVSYTYDLSGQRLTLADGTGTTTYQRDERGLLTQVTVPGGAATQYRYDLDGQRTRLIYPTGSATLYYDYDKAGRLLSLVDWAGGTTSYDYWPDGQRKLLTHRNGSTQERAYDAAGRLTVLSNLANGGAVITRDAATLDGLGNPTGIAVTDQWAPPHQTLTHTYDGLNRLTTFNDAGSGFGSLVYNYDTASNRSSMTDDGVSSGSYQYDTADRLFQVGTHSYGYDPNGNTTFRPVGITTANHVFDQEDRLTQASITGGTATYTYDGDGRRTRKVVTTTTTKTTTYLDDLSGSLPVLLEDGERRYAHAGGVGYSIALANPSDVQVYHTDARGSVRAITGATSLVEQKTRYDPYGNALHQSTVLPQPFGFAGEQRDPESGLIYLRARLYDPAIGRFLQRDSVAGSATNPVSLNRYTYAGNNPVSQVDPSGNQYFPTGCNYGFAGYPVCLYGQNWFSQMGAAGGGGHAFLTPMGGGALGPGLPPGYLNSWLWPYAQAGHMFSYHIGWSPGALVTRMGLEPRTRVSTFSGLREAEFAFGGMLAQQGPRIAQWVTDGTPPTNWFWYNGGPPLGPEYGPYFPLGFGIERSNLGPPPTFETMFNANFHLGLNPNAPSGFEVFTGFPR